MDDAIGCVTPCVGVWIETSVLDNRVHGGESHPAWVCGLKLLLPGGEKGVQAVTPCVGVWIETLDLAVFYLDHHQSHPAWVCGLKLIIQTI